MIPDKPVLVPNDQEWADLHITNDQLRNVKWISLHAPERHTRDKAFDRYSELLERKKRADGLREKFSVVESVSAISL